MSVVMGITAQSCVFCGRINVSDVQRTDVSGVHMFEPLNPVTPGHMLFVPDVHLVDASEYPYDSAEVFEAASWYAKNKGDDFNLITSGGEYATQTIMHMHVHYVPRREGDGLLLPWSNQVKVTTVDPAEPYSLAKDGPQ